MNEREAIERIRDHMEVHRIGAYPHIKLGEALNMAIDALRARQTTLNGTYVSIEWFNAVKAELDTLKAERAAKLDRSRWEGCVVCNRCGVSGSNELLCNGTEAQYCPFCGRPLAEDAWAELERRINGGTAD